MGRILSLILVISTLICCWNIFLLVTKSNDSPKLLSAELEGQYSFKEGYELHAGKPHIFFRNFSEWKGWKIFLIIWVIITVNKRKGTSLWISLVVLMAGMTRVSSSVEIIKKYGTLSEECAWDIVAIPTGGYYVAGYTGAYPGNGMDVWVLKLDSKGDKLWDQVSDSILNDYAYAIDLTSNGGCVVAGTFNENSNPYVLILNEDGIIEWEQIVTSVAGYAFGITRLNNNELLIAGKSVGISADEGFVSRARGVDVHEIWLEIYTSTTIIEKAVELPDGDIAAIGRYNNLHCIYLRLSGVDGHILKEVTNIKFGQSETFCWRIIKVADGNLVIAGEARPGQYGDMDAFFLKITTDGDTIWSKCLGTPGYDYSRSVVETMNGDLIFVGGSDPGTFGGMNFWLFRTNSDGEFTGWEKRLGGAYAELGHSIAIGADGAIAAVGYTTIKGHDFYVVIIPSAACSPGEHFDTEDSACKPCAKFCENCASTTICLTCFENEGIVFDKGVCECKGEGYKEYFNAITNTFECIKCHPLCSQCHGAQVDQCDSCYALKNAVFLSPSTCQCAARHFYDESKGACVPCHRFCLSCVGPDSDQCTECDSVISFTVEESPNKCVLNCENGYFRSERTCQSMVERITHYRVQ
eukprot:TRINITY_DN120337_c0_g1_i1.p1 TRINITY_DN120337_c0_g1~~TRINITY_DN120337_c0_g1_i1.p1  ORF type:complete len:637 (+),score=28.99 TRINITY_DN120337_c0_g1_i1:196-2106(+)